MASSKATTVQEYLKEQPADRRQELKSVRKVIRTSLPKGFEEAMNYGMITYQIPLKKYADTYNGQPLCMAALAAQKNYLVLYLMNVYSDPMTEKWFTSRYEKSGKKLNMGKSCVRFQKAEDLPLDLIGEVIARQSAQEFITSYEKSRAKK